MFCVCVYVCAAVFSHLLFQVCVCVCMLLLFFISYKFLPNQSTIEQQTNNVLFERTSVYSYSSQSKCVLKQMQVFVCVCSRVSNRFLAFNPMAWHSQHIFDVFDYSN